MDKCFFSIYRRTDSIVLNLARIKSDFHFYPTIRMDRKT